MRRGTLLAFVVTVLWGFHVPTASASAQRTFVKSDGLDTNACTIPAPCRTFGQAITQTNDGGEIIVLDSAGYGTVVITQSVSIVAPHGIYGGITVPAGDGVTIATPGVDVILQGLTINGLGGLHGIAFSAGSSLMIDDCVVSGMSSTGILLSGANTQTSIRNTTVRDNGGGGIRLASVAAGTVIAVLDAVTSERNIGPGLDTGSGAIARVRGGAYVRNAGAGIIVQAALANPEGAAVSVTQARIADNAGHGILFFPTAGNGVQLEGSIAECEIASNGGDGVSVQTGPITGWAVRATLARNRIFRNGGNGIFAMAPASSVHVILVGNTITRNFDAGVRNDIANPGTVESSIDNMVDRNDGPQKSGTILVFMGT